MICLDCKRIVIDEDIVYCSLDAYDDEPDALCPFCGGDQLVEVYED